MSCIILWCFLTENKKKVVVIKLLQSRGYPSDPVKKWKQSVNDGDDEEEGEGEGEGEGEEREGEAKGGDKSADYNYLLSMSLWSLTLEKKEELLKKRDEKVHDALLYIVLLVELVSCHSHEEYISQPPKRSNSEFSAAISTGNGIENTEGQDSKRFMEGGPGCLHDGAGCEFHRVKSAHIH